jgi:hypothetical protein
MKYCQESKKVNPERIQKMPVSGTELYSQQILGMNFITLGFPGYNQNKDYGRKNMQHVQASENIQKRTCYIIS